jgi:hypothetical protein
MARRLSVIDRQTRNYREWKKKQKKMNPKTIIELNNEEKTEIRETLNLIENLCYILLRFY